MGEVLLKASAYVFVIIAGYVLKKLGFGFEGRHKKEYYYNGISADIDIYAMTDDEYAKGDENGTEADSQLQRESQHA